MGKQTVWVVTPTRGEFRPELARFRESLLLAELQADRYQLAMGISEAQPIANNRNQIARNMLARGYDWLLTVDHDNVPTCNPLDYIDLDLDVLGFCYATWRANNDPPVVWIPGPPSDVGLVEVPRLPGGVLLIARRVFEHSDMQAPFRDMFMEDGRRVEPEDWNFSRRAGEAGFKVWCDFSKPALHFKMAEMGTLWRWTEKLVQEASND